MWQSAPKKPTGLAWAAVWEGSEDLGICTCNLKEEFKIVFQGACADPQTLSDKHHVENLDMPIPEGPDMAPIFKSGPKNNAIALRCIYIYM